jgi:hypothetical protein
MAFNWFTSLAPNSVTTWAGLEEKIHDYFYKGETKLKLSDLMAVRQKNTLRMSLNISKGSGKQETSVIV